MEILRDEMVEELISIILSQDRKIKNLQHKLNQITQYLETYEEYISKGDD